jgi:hypothetical protein
MARLCMSDARSESCDAYGIVIPQIRGSTKSVRKLRETHGAELRALRKQAAKRFGAIALQHVREGWTVEYHKALSGSCWPAQKRIQAPRPVTRKALNIFLHECAHAHLHRDGGKARHVMEMESERWAHENARARDCGPAQADPGGQVERGEADSARYCRWGA